MSFTPEMLNAVLEHMNEGVHPAFLLVEQKELVRLALEHLEVKPKLEALERLYHAADRFTDCAAEFPGYPAACGELYQELEDATLKAMQVLRPERYAELEQTWRQALVDQHD